MASLWSARRAAARRRGERRPGGDEIGGPEAMRSVQRRATAEQVRSQTPAAGKGMASR